MHRRLGPLTCFVALGVVAIAVLPAASFGEGSSSPPPPPCAGSTTTTTAAGPSGGTSTTNIPPGSSIAPGSPQGGTCWVEQPYPFGIGSNGEPVEPPATAQSYLSVTSMAFRAWNRGLAAVTQAGNEGEDPYGVWVFNGVRWYPSPGFPGKKLCGGHTIVWAGQKDYWLIGGEPNREGKWADLCRFDGVSLEWEYLPIPEATMQHVAQVYDGTESFKSGTIDSAACMAWNNCWFFGTYGTVVHWEGHFLTDASPNPSERTLQGEYTDAVAREGPAGEPFGLAVAATAERYEGEKESVPLEPSGPPPVQLYGSSGAPFSPLPFTPPSEAQHGDQYRTDLVAVDLDAAGQGWVAGNPAALRLKEREGSVPSGHDPAPPSTRPFNPPNAPQPSPLVPISTSGAAPTCPGPETNRFTYTPTSGATEPAGAFLWSTIGVVPGSGEALAGGRMRRAPASAGPGPNEGAAVGEPVIARASCAGTTAVTRFRIKDPTSPGHEAPADSQGSVTAIAVNAPNDAWAATSEGFLASGAKEEPHLYRLTNGQPPDAPEGAENEERPRELQENEATFVFLPPVPEPPPQAPAAVTQTQTVTLPAAIYDVKAKLHERKHDGHVYLSLYITFKLRRPTKVGAQALRHGHVVSVAKAKLFAGKSGLLILSLNRKHWPTKVNFVS